jgi:hypothetical protein
MSMNPTLTLLLMNSLFNSDGEIFDFLGRFIVLGIFGTALIGAVRLILGLVKVAKTPPVPPIKGSLEIGRWGEGSYEGPMYGDPDGNSGWGWPDSSGHSSIDFSMGGDGGGVCDAGGFDGGDCSGD